MYTWDQIHGFEISEVRSGYIKASYTQRNPRSNESWNLHKCHFMWWKKWTHKSPSKSCAAESTRSNQAEEKDGGGNETLSKTHHMKWWGHKQGWESILQVKQVSYTSTNHKEKQKLKRSSSCAKKNFERSNKGVHGEVWRIERDGISHRSRQGCFFDGSQNDMRDPEEQILKAKRCEKDEKLTINLWRMATVNLKKRFLY